jgi:hypothetical protein
VPVASGQSQTAVQPGPDGPAEEEQPQPGADPSSGAGALHEPQPPRHPCAGTASGAASKSAKARVTIRRMTTRADISNPPTPERPRLLREWGGHLKSTPKR